MFRKNSTQTLTTRCQKKPDCLSMYFRLYAQSNSPEDPLSRYTGCSDQHNESRWFCEPCPHVFGQVVRPDWRFGTIPRKYPELWCDESPDYRPILQDHFDRASATAPGKHTPYLIEEAFVARATYAKAPCDPPETLADRRVICLSAIRHTRIEAG